MFEAAVTATIAALTAMGVITQKLHTRISELDRRIDSIELRVASDYVTKTELGVIMERMEAHLIRIEEKMDRISINCRS
jgi:uncharacterized coiled-coil protein SlyX